MIALVLHRLARNSHGCTCACCGRCHHRDFL